MRGPLRRKVQGFTLLEILITVVVLSTGLVLVLQGLHSVLHIWHGGVQRTRSLMRAQEAFARFRYASVTEDRLTSSDGVRIEERFGGRDGLYRLVYEAIEGMHEHREGGNTYEMLLYIAPEREGHP